MKKQIKKLSLNKVTITNLSAPSMTKFEAAGATNNCNSKSCFTCKGRSCGGACGSF